MKLLLDQNISYKLIKPLENYFAEVIQIGRLGLGQTDDGMIWQFALVNNYMIVTFDAYFQERNLISGNPVKVLWLQFKDTSTENIIHKIIENIENIKMFFENQEVSCLKIL
jgi:predicted nuclease of predicted toxin-antitoxin system